MSRPAGPADPQGGQPPTPLSRKLGIRSGMRVLVTDPPAGYWDRLGDALAGTHRGVQGGRHADFIHVFAPRRSFLESRLPGLRARLEPDGMLWVSWPKRASGVETDLTREVVRELGLAAGLVDVKVCAVDETWSALKFVVPVAARPDRQTGRSGGLA